MVLVAGVHNVTGIELFKTQALKGLSTYMADWPKIIATESITEELSRLLLPLAWRVRVEDTPAHRAELRECWEALKRNWTCTPQPGSAHFASQARRISDSATTVRAGAGVPTCTMSPYGQMCAPCTTNQCYGNGERSVCQETGDPASDVLCEECQHPSHLRTPSYRSESSTSFSGADQSARGRCDRRVQLLAAQPPGGLRRHGRAGLPPGKSQDHRRILVCVSSKNSDDDPACTQAADQLSRYLARIQATSKLYPQYEVTSRPHADDLSLSLGSIFSSVTLPCTGDVVPWLRLFALGDLRQQRRLGLACLRNRDGL